MSYPLRVQDSFEFINLLFRRRPTGDEAADGMMLVGLTEMGELYLLAETFCLCVVDDDKLLVGGGVD